MKSNPRTTQMFFTLLAHRERCRDRFDSLRGRIVNPDRQPALASPRPKPGSSVNPPKQHPLVGE